MDTRRSDMSFDDLLREVVATGRLAEPFTASDAARAISLEDWPLTKIQNFLARHCIGNLAARVMLVERVSYGKYRLIYDGPRDDPFRPSPPDGEPVRPPRRTTSDHPGEPQS
jgi:hypothetical protein